MKAFFKFVGILILLTVVFFGYVFYIGYTRGPVIEEKVTDFLILASSGETAKAHEFFAEEVKVIYLLDEFTAGVFIHFDQFTFVEQNQSGYSYNIALLKEFGLSKSLPAGVYEYSGIVTYEGGKEGIVRMAFIKEDGDWKVLNIHISDPF